MADPPVGYGEHLLLSHIEHLIRVGGSDCAALGSDYDGTIIPVAGMGDVTRLPSITQALLGRGHAPEVIRKLLGENALRVIASVTGKQDRHYQA